MLFCSVLFVVFDVGRLPLFQYAMRRWNRKEKGSLGFVMEEVKVGLVEAEDQKAK